MGEADTGKLSVEEANELVLEHRGWAESIARSVARSWNLDWQLDGLDGAAMEALIFCSRRFQPDRGVPFRGYARKRIHEASSDAARKSKGWMKGLGTSSAAQRQAREVSADLLTVFPELRSGRLPSPDELTGNADLDTRSAVRNLLVGASIIAAKQGISTSLPDEVMDYKRSISILAQLEPVHQEIIWKVYWEGFSLRNVADGWEIDELNVIREHKVLLAFMQKALTKGKGVPNPKVRPGLKKPALMLKQKKEPGPFTKISKGNQIDD